MVSLTHGLPTRKEKGARAWERPERTIDRGAKTEEQLMTQGHPAASLVYRTLPGNVGLPESAATGDTQAIGDGVNIAEQANKLLRSRSGPAAGQRGFCS